MKTKQWLVLNPHDSEYALFKADSLDSLMRTLGTTDCEENGTYISHNTPVYQVLDINDTTFYDLR